MLRETRLSRDQATGDQRVTASHEIDRLPAPAGDLAIPDHDVLEPGAFDPVEISPRPYVLHLYVLDENSLYRLIHFATVVDIDPVELLAFHNDVPEFETRSPAEMKRFVSAFEDRSVLRIHPFHSEVRDTGYTVPARERPMADP